MARATALSLILLAACLGVALAGRVLDTRVARRSALAGQLTPVGWHHALKVKNGMWCGLRDFPPIPDGYGAARLYCISKKVDHVWMWRVQKVDAGAISSGDQVHLTIQNPMLKYCRSAAQVMCGVGPANATKFTIEKESGTGAIALTSDNVVLKVGTKYCKLSGSNHGQQLKCDTASKASATVFQLPANSFVAVNIINELSMAPCGGDFYFDQPGVPYIGCGSPRGPGYATNATVALQVPVSGAPLVAAGANVTFKTYDDLYSYQVSVWKMNQSKKVWFDVNNTKGTGIWFQLERITGPATGGAVANMTTIAIKSTNNGMYCGVADMDADMVCDKAGPLASLGAGYKYKYLIVA